MVPDDPPLDHEVYADATLTRAPTAEHPARIHVSFTNLADTERGFWFGTVVPFTPKRVFHTEVDARLQFVPLDGVGVLDSNDDGEFHAVPQQPSDGCWQADDEVVFTDEERLERFGYCETLQATFDVVGHPSNDGCQPAGSYRAERTWRTSDEYGETSQEVDITWGFDVRLE